MPSFAGRVWPPARRALAPRGSWGEVAAGDCAPAVSRGLPVLDASSAALLGMPVGMPGDVDVGARST